MKTLRWNVRHVSPLNESLLVVLEVIDGDPSVGQVVRCEETGRLFEVKSLALGGGPSKRKAVSLTPFDAGDPGLLPGFELAGPAPGNPAAASRWSRGENDLVHEG